MLNRKMAWQRHCHTSPFWSESGSADAQRQVTRAPALAGVHLQDSALLPEAAWQFAARPSGGSAAPRDRDAPLWNPGSTRRLSHLLRFTALSLFRHT